MKILRYLYPPIILLLLISCTEDVGENIDHKSKIYEFQSEMGNTIKITLPEGDIYSYENTLMEVTFRYQADLSPQMPDWKEITDYLNILNIRNVYGPVEENGLVTRTVEVTIGDLLPGDYIIKPLKIVFYSNNQIADEISSDTIQLNILSSLINGEEDILGDPQFIDIKKRPIALIVTGSVLSLILITGLMFFYFYRKRNKNGKDDIPVGKNYIDMINNLPTEDLKFLYMNLNRIIKEYMEIKLFIPAESKTTEEFIEYSKMLPLMEEWLKIQLFNFLKHSDEVKFGAYIPEDEKIRGDILFCIDFIEYLNKKVVEEVSL